MEVAPQSVVKKLADYGLAETSNYAQNTDVFFVRLLNLAKLRIRSSASTPFLIAKKFAGGRDASAEDIEELVAAAEVEMKRLREDPRLSVSRDSFGIVMIGGSVPPQISRTHCLPRSPRIVILDGSDLAQISRTADGAIAARVVSIACGEAMGRSAIAPYVLGAPARGPRFFGRKNILKRVSASAGSSFTFTGTRRIGKTSLLHEVRNRLISQDPRLLVVELYGNNLDSSYEVMRQIVSEAFTSQRIATLRDDQIASKGVASDIKKIVRSNDRRLAIFFDELDHVLKWDAANNYAVLNILREISYSDDVSIYFAGVRDTMRAIEDQRNPLHNFTSVEWLAPFERSDTFDMVEIPLGNLGIEVRGTDLSGIIHRESGGQPELISHLCLAIIDHFENTGEIAGSQDISSFLATDRKYESTIFRTFIQNTTPIERLLSMQLIKRTLKAESRNLEVSVSDILNIYDSECKPLLSDTFIDDVSIDFRTVISNLEIAGVIARVAGTPVRYRFAVPRLADYLKVNDLEGEIAKLSEVL